jgi:hypothetical protein
VHSGEPEIELEEAKKKLAATPESAPIVRRLLQLKVQNLEKQIRAKGGIGPSKSGEPKEAPHDKKIQTQRACKGGDWATKYQSKNRFTRRPMSIGEMAAERKLNETSEAIGRGTESPPDDSGVRVEREDADCDVAAELPSAAALQNDQVATHPQYRSVLDAKISEEARNYVLNSINSAEQKAMFFLALLTTMLVFVITHTARTRWLADGVQWSFVDFLAMLSMLGLGVAAALMLAVLYRSLQDSDRGLRFLNAMTEPDKPVGCADGSVDRPFEYLTQVLQEDFYELTSRYEAASRALRQGFWVGSIAAFVSLLFLLLSRTEHAQQSLSGPPF